MMLAPLVTGGGGGGVAGFVVVVVVRLVVVVGVVVVGGLPLRSQQNWNQEVASKLQAFADRRYR